MPACINQVALVCRIMCGVILPSPSSSPAIFRTLDHAYHIRSKGTPQCSQTYTATGVEVYPVPPQVSDYTAAGAGIDTKQDKPGDARPAAGAGTSSRIQRVRGSGFGGSTI
jgi:hypothetical protein